jgi:hypothetical protein
VWRYVLLVHGDEPETVYRQIVTATKDAIRQEDIMTAGEVLMQRGEQRGELKGRRTTLGKLLTARFGPLPAWATARLESAGVTELDAWTTRVITAASLEEALGG